MNTRNKLLTALTFIVLTSSAVPASEYPVEYDGILESFNSPSDAVINVPVYRDVLDAPALRSKDSSKHPLIGIVATNTRIICVGLRGNIIYSDNLGRSWTQARVPVSSDLVAVNFPTEKYGWAVGHDGVVLHSEDGGDSWVKQFDGRAAAQVMAERYLADSPPQTLSNLSEEDREYLIQDINTFLSQGADKPFLDVWFKNENNGYIVGAFGLIFHTNNGGKSWSPFYDRIDNPSRAHIYSIDEIEGDLYLAGEQGTIFKLNQKENYFERLNTPYDGTFFGITGFRDMLIAYGMRGSAYFSKDRGESWEKIPTKLNSGLVGSALNNDGTLAIVSQGGQLLITDKENLSFQHVATGEVFPLASVAAANANTYIFVGQGGVSTFNLKQ